MDQESRPNTIREFTDLFAWQEGHALVLKIYTITKQLPENEKYGLVSQMQRASVSVTSNIAEGFGRRGQKEKIQFYYIAHGSLTELKNLIFVIRDLGFITSTNFQDIFQTLSRTQALLIGLIKKTKLG